MHWHATTHSTLSPTASGFNESQNNLFLLIGYDKYVLHRPFDIMTRVRSWHHEDAPISVIP